MSMNPADILTEGQARVMVHLREHGPQTTDEIGTAMGWEPPIKFLRRLALLGFLRFVSTSFTPESDCQYAANFPEARFLWWLAEDGAE